MPYNGVETQHYHRTGRRRAVKLSVDAVYEHGNLRLLEPVDLEEGQRVRVELDTDEDPLEVLAGAYDGLSERQIQEIEDAILNRRPLFGGRERP